MGIPDSFRDKFIYWVENFKNENFEDEEEDEDYEVDYEYYINQHLGRKWEYDDEGNITKMQLELYDVPTTFITGLFENIPTLKVLNLSYSMDDDIPKPIRFEPSAFRGLINLEALNIVARFDQFPPNLFNDIPNLKSLWIGDDDYYENTDEFFEKYKTEIELPDGMFHNLSLLEELNFQTVGVIKIHENTFEGLNNLNHLNLSHNNLTNLPENVFQPLVNLSWVSLAYNFLEKLPEVLFHNNTKLERIIIGHNKIKTLDSNFFINNTALTYFYADENKFEKLPRNLFQNTPSLKEIGLECEPQFPFYFHSDFEISINKLPKFTFQNLELFPKWSSFEVKHLDKVEQDPNEFVLFEYSIFNLRFTKFVKLPGNSIIDPLDAISNDYIMRTQILIEMERKDLTEAFCFFIHNLSEMEKIRELNSELLLINIHNMAIDERINFLNTYQFSQPNIELYLILILQEHIDLLEFSIKTKYPTVREYLVDKVPDEQLRRLLGCDLTTMAKHKLILRLKNEKLAKDWFYEILEYPGVAVQDLIQIITDDQFLKSAYPLANYWKEAIGKRYQEITGIKIHEFESDDEYLQSISEDNLDTALNNETASLRKSAILLLDKDLATLITITDKSLAEHETFKVFFDYDLLQKLENLDISNYKPEIQNALKDRKRKLRFQNWLFNVFNPDHQTNLWLVDVFMQKNTSLSLSGSGLTEFPTEIFFYYKNLKSLDLSSNSIKQLEDLDIPNTSLTELRLNNNKIETISPKFFSKMPLLKSLHLQNNLITELNDTIFDQVRDLRILWLNNNMLTHLPTSILSLRYLSNASIAANPVANVAADIIKLNKNHFSFIDSVVIDDLKKYIMNQK